MIACNQLIIIFKHTWSLWMVKTVGMDYNYPESSNSLERVLSTLWDVGSIIRCLKGLTTNNQTCTQQLD